jgi:hypothetical protein
MFLDLLFTVYATSFGATCNNNHILDFRCSTQQQKIIMSHNEGKLFNPKPLVYLFLVLGA